MRLLITVLSLNLALRFGDQPFSRSEALSRYGRIEKLLTELVELNILRSWVEDRQRMYVLTPGNEKTRSTELTVRRDEPTDDTRRGEEEMG